MSDEERTEKNKVADPVTRAAELLRRAAHNAGGEAGAEYAQAADALEKEPTDRPNEDGEEEDRYEPTEPNS